MMPVHRRVAIMVACAFVLAIIGLGIASTGDQVWSELEKACHCMYTTSGSEETYRLLSPNTNGTYGGGAGATSLEIPRRVYR